MAVCNIQELLDANPCFAALSPSMLQAVITQQLCNLRENLDSGAAMTCDIATLIEDAGCFSNLSPEQHYIVQASLLCDIASLLG